MTTQWTPITSLDNIPVQEGRAVKVGDIEIAIFHLKDRVRTIENRCPHMGGPLCDGIVAGSSVVCPLHGRRFDLETGMPVRATEPDCVAIFPTRVENGIIYVDLQSAHRAVETAA